VPVPADRRSYAVTLTPAGRRAHTSANRWFEQVNERFLAALDRDEAELRGYLSEILAATRQNASRGT
jgi:DNA-binding MarR family transcriptional regulator